MLDIEIYHEAEAFLIVLPLRLFAREKLLHVPRFSSYLLVERAKRVAPRFNALKRGAICCRRIRGESQAGCGLRMVARLPCGEQ